MKEARYLAFDLGGESGRAVLGWIERDRLCTEVVHRFENRPVRTADGLHWDILALWAEMQHGLALAAQRCGSSLASVGVDTWGSDFALLDRQGTLLANPWHYRDRRTDAMQEAVERIVPRAELYAQTGNQSMRQNTVLQLLAMAESGSPLLDAAATLLMIPDLFHYWLSGERYVEFSGATTTQFYNPRAGRWATELLERLGIPTHFLPPIVPAGTHLGTLLPWVQESCACGPLAVVAPVTHDTGSAVVAAPTLERQFAYISSGTWSLVGAEVEQPVIDPQGLALNITNEGGLGGTFRFLKNVLGLWLVQESRRTYQRQGFEHAYEEMAAAARQTPALRSIVDPDDPSFFEPGDMPARIAAYCRRTGQPVPEGMGAVVRCILESLALKYRYVIEAIEGILGYRLEPVIVLGGGARNALLNQCTADALQRTVVAGPVEATALGNLAAQMIAAGELADRDEARALIRDSSDLVIYEPGAGAAWDSAYTSLRALLDRASAHPRKDTTS
jgi:rhamnulokinase